MGEAYKKFPGASGESHRETVIAPDQMIDWINSVREGPRVWQCSNLQRNSELHVSTQVLKSDLKTYGSSFPSKSFTKPPHFLLFPLSFKS